MTIFCEMEQATAEVCAAVELHRQLLASGAQSRFDVAYKSVQLLPEEWDREQLARMWVITLLMLIDAQDYTPLRQLLGQAEADGSKVISIESVRLLLDHQQHPLNGAGRTA